MEFSLNGCLGKLLFDAEYDYSDAEVIVQGTSVGVNRCILASRSQFFHELFKKNNAGSISQGKPKYLMTDLVPYGNIGHETFMVFLNYVYTGKLKPPPTEISTCIDESCAHDACAPAINYAVELMYASATFQMKELVLLAQRRLLNFVRKASEEDVIPILRVAFHCQLNQLLSLCVERVAKSDLDNLTPEKELPNEVLSDIKSSRIRALGYDAFEVALYDKRIRRIHKALDVDDIELLKLLLKEYSITLDDVYALHYAAAYCNSKVVREVLSLGIADLNLRNTRGYTVLHIAARRKDPSIIVNLLCSGASVIDATLDGKTAVTICRRLTWPKDYNETPKQGHESNRNRLCIDVLEREMYRNLLTNSMLSPSMILVDDLVMGMQLLENRALAQALFPREAKVALETANACLTSELADIFSSESSCAYLRDLDLNKIPPEVKQIRSRFQTLQKTVEIARWYFPNCSDTVDRFLEDEMKDSLLLPKDPPEEWNLKKRRYRALKEAMRKAFEKDKAENNWSSFSSSSSCSSKHSINRKNQYVDSGLRLFPNWSEVEVELLSDKCDLEGSRIKKIKLMELEEDVVKESAIDEAENSRTDFSSSSDNRLLEKAKMILRGGNKTIKMRHRRVKKQTKTFDAVDKWGNYSISLSSSSSSENSPLLGH